MSTTDSDQVVLISYSRDSELHIAKVRQLADTLRQAGVKVEIDQYLPTQGPREGWPRWMTRMIESAAWILVICTETYRRRFDGQERPGLGKGATWEALLLQMVLYEAQTQNDRLVPVVFDDEPESSIPRVLRPYVCFRLPDQVTALYAVLTKQHHNPAPPVGPPIKIRAPERPDLPKEWEQIAQDLGDSAWLHPDANRSAGAATAAPQGDDDDRGTLDNGTASPDGSTASPAPAAASAGKVPDNSAVSPDGVANRDSAWSDSGTASPSGAAKYKQTGSGAVPEKNRALLAGRYRLLGELGSGGMGEVHRAWDIRANRQVAVKRPIGGAADGRAERLKREGHIIARLEGRNVIKLLDSGTDETGAPFIVLDLLDGESLSDRLMRGPLSPDDVYQVLFEVLEVLKEAHSKRVILRDVKPSNIFIQAISGGSQQIRVLDFGVAKDLEASDDDDVPVTQVGGYVGTLRYMAPEQAMGHPTEKSDLFSLGVTAYEAAVGRIPWTEEALYGSNPEQKAMVSDLEFPAAFPQALSDLITHLMNPNAGLRPRSAAQAYDRLLTLQTERDLPDSALQIDVSASSLPRPAVLGSLLLVSVAVASVALWQVCAAAPESGPAPRTIETGTADVGPTNTAKRPYESPKTRAATNRRVTAQCKSSAASEDARYVEQRSMAILSACRALQKIGHRTDARLSIHIYSNERDVRPRIAPVDPRDKRWVEGLERCLVRRANELLPPNPETLSFWTMSCKVAVEVSRVKK